MEILTAVLTLGGLGLLFGAGLAVASKRLAVKTDPKLEKIVGLLPGANCGACGGAGCFGFAEAVLAGKMSIDACRVAEHGNKEEIARILGQALEKKTRKIAVLHCYGGLKVKDRFIYNGIEDCVAANIVLGGEKSCVYGCLGFGSCERVCPFGAIKMSREGLPVVNPHKCKACNKCVLICPKKLFSLVSTKQNIYVACKSLDSGRDTKTACPVGCIACRLCEKACKFDAIHITDNLAAIDYEKCTSCGECLKVCSVKAIAESVKCEV